MNLQPGAPEQYSFIDTIGSGLSSIFTSIGSVITFKAFRSTSNDLLVANNNTDGSIDFSIDESKISIQTSQVHGDLDGGEF